MARGDSIFWLQLWIPPHDCGEHKIVKFRMDDLHYQQSKDPQNPQIEANYNQAVAEYDLVCIASRSVQDLYKLFVILMCECDNTIMCRQNLTTSMVKQIIRPHKECKRSITNLLKVLESNKEVQLAEAMTAYQVDLGT